MAAEPKVSAWWGLAGAVLGVGMDVLLAAWLFQGKPSRTNLSFADLLASAVAAAGLLVLGLGIALMTGHAVAARAEQPRDLAPDDAAKVLAGAFKDLPASRAVALVGVVLVLAAAYLARPASAVPSGPPVPSPSASP
jgi:hypothetical protein